jgi:TonB family protein
MLVAMFRSTFILPLLLASAISITVAHAQPQPVRPPQFFDYAARIQKEIRADWKFNGPRPKTGTVITLNLSSEGEVLDVEVTKSSGDERYDYSVLAAVGRANPLPAPPPDLYQKYFTVFRLAFHPAQPQPGPQADRMAR